MTAPGWVYWSDGEHGPFEAERLEVLVRQGAIDGRTDLRPADQLGWAPAQTLFPELFAARASDGSEAADPRAWTDARPHPWRRFAARLADISVVGGIASIAIFIVGYTVWPERTEAVAGALGRGAGQLVGAVLVMLVMIPLNALAIGLSGLTFGKWIFGVRVLKDGRPIGFLRALRRELGVFAFGMGCGLPLISLVTTIYNFASLSRGRATPWDRDQKLEIVHRPESRNATVAMVLAAAALALVSIALNLMPQLG